MSLLRYRLRRCGYSPVQFSYHTISLSPRENAANLQVFLQSLGNAEQVHFVAHSLGGLVIRHLFHDFPQQKPGRVVTIGTPHCGSQVVERLMEFSWGRKILGKSVIQGLCGQVPEWQSENPLGVIAGNRSFGAGRLFCHFSGENDGTVSVSETRLANATDHIVVPSSHTGLIYNKLVASKACSFIDHKMFSRPAIS